MRLGIVSSSTYIKVRFGMAATLGTLPDIEQFRILLKLSTPNLM